MKRTAWLALGAALLAVPAAADQPVYQWSGFYVGGQAGYAMADVREGYHVAPGVAYWNRGAEGASAGVFLGYNHLAGNWLGGVEIEGNWSDLADAYYTDLNGQPYYRANSSAAARMRFGFLPSASTLLYGSVGVARTTFDYSHGFWSGGSRLAVSPIGLQLGAGIESFLNPHLSVRAEGVFTHHVTNTLTYSGNPYWDVTPDTLVARLGVAYHPGWLGEPQAEAPTSEPAVYSWSGLYAGIHGGAAAAHRFDSFLPPPAPPDVYRDMSSSSGVVGAHAGVNWQTGNLVAGIEAEGSLVNQVSRNSAIVWGTQTWTAAVRARLGVVAMNNTLFYATVGWAAGHFDYSQVFSSPLQTEAVFTTGGLQFGAGAEAFVMPKLSVRVEGLYTTYDSHTILYLGNPYWKAESHSLEARVGVTYHLRGGAPAL